jgi:acyl-CoA thioester hydrolase
MSRSADSQPGNFYNRAASAATFVWPVRVYYEDTDFSGVVYHANYLKFFERARTEWLREVGAGQEELRAGAGVVFTVADLSMRFVRPARLDDMLEVHMQVAERRRVSLSFVQWLLRGRELLAEARVRVACVDAATFRPRVLPAVMFTGEAE